MTATVQSLVDETRVLLRDPVPTAQGASPYYSNDLIARGIADAYRRLCAKQPSERYAGGVIDDVVFPTATADLLAFSLTFEDRRRRGLVHFAAACCHEADINDSVHQQLAQTLRAMAEQEFS